MLNLVGQMNNLSDSKSYAYTAIRSVYLLLLLLLFTENGFAPGGSGTTIHKKKHKKHKITHIHSTNTQHTKLQTE